MSAGSMAQSNNEGSTSSGEVEAPVILGMRGSPGAGGVETSDGGISLGGAVTGAGAGSIASGSNETRKGTGGLSSLGKGASSGAGAKLSGKRFEPATPAAPVKISETLRHPGRPYRESEIYWETERYVLHGPDLRMGIAVPGNEIGREGDLLRTRETFVFTQVETDMKRCSQKHPGEGEVIESPSIAETRVVAYNDNLSSPVNYTVNTCLVYDKTHCSLVDPGDSERTSCRAIHKYEGLWDSGTTFDYKCTKSQSKTYSHSLEYRVRFSRHEFMGYKVPKLKVTLHTETRSIRNSDLAKAPQE